MAPPLYVLTTNSLDKNLGVETLEKAIAKIEETIKKEQGMLTIKMKPKAISEQDELELAKLMEQAERENAEVSGDEEDEEDNEDESKALVDDEEDEEEE